MTGYIKLWLLVSETTEAGLPKLKKGKVRLENQCQIYHNFRNLMDNIPFKNGHQNTRWIGYLHELIRH